MLWFPWININKWKNRLRCNTFLVGKISATAEVNWPARTHKIKAVINIIKFWQNCLVLIPEKNPIRVSLKIV